MKFFFLSAATVLSLVCPLVSTAASFKSLRPLGTVSSVDSTDYCIHPNSQKRNLLTFSASAVIRTDDAGDAESKLEKLRAFYENDLENSEFNYSFETPGSGPDFSMFLFMAETTHSSQNETLKQWAEKHREYSTGT
jgi:hypothetical protein